jgi:hypothetical protein
MPFARISLLHPLGDKQIFTGRGLLVTQVPARYKTEPHEGEAPARGNYRPVSVTKLDSHTIGYKRWRESDLELGLEEYDLAVVID